MAIHVLTSNAELARFPGASPNLLSFLLLFSAPVLELDFSFHSLPGREPLCVVLRLDDEERAFLACDQAEGEGAGSWCHGARPRSKERDTSAQAPRNPSLEGHCALGASEVAPVTLLLDLGM